MLSLYATDHNWVVEETLGSALIWSNGQRGGSLRYSVTIGEEEPAESDKISPSLKEAKKQAEDLMHCLIKRNSAERTLLSARQCARLLSRINSR